MASGFILLGSPLLNFQNPFEDYLLPTLNLKILYKRGNKSSSKKNFG